MKCLYLNAQSIVKKIGDLHVLINQICPDLIFMTETWLSNAFNDSILGLNNYTVFRRDRAMGTDPHGGVVLAVRTTLNPILVSSVSNSEVLFCDISVNLCKFRLCVCYRPPLTSAEQSLNFINAIKQYSEVSHELCIVGDFNMSGINWTDGNSSSSVENLLLDAINELGLHQMVRQPTREKNILDLVLCSDFDSVYNLQVNETFSKADHSYITFSLKIRQSQDVKRTIYNYKRADWELMRAHAATIDWDLVLLDCDGDCENAWIKLKHIIQNFVDLYVPTSVKSNKLNAPWITHNLKRMSRKKQRMWNKYKRSNQTVHSHEYRSYCKTVHLAVTKERVSHERKKFRNRCSIPKKSLTM